MKAGRAALEQALTAQRAGLTLPKALEVQLAAAQASGVELRARKERDAGRANRGQSLQRLLDGQHAAYVAMRRALVVEQFAKVIRRGRAAGEDEGSALFTTATPRIADYMGTLWDGRAVALEAKEAHCGALRIDAVTNGQRKFMGDWHGLGVLVVQLYDGTRPLGAWAVPFGAYLRAWELAQALPGQRRAKGQGSLTPAQLDALGVRLHGVDWLGPLMAGAPAFKLNGAQVAHDSAQAGAEVAR